MTASLPALLITTGEPAGIGPDITLQLACETLPVALAALGDPELLESRRRLLGLDVQLVAFDAASPPPPHEPGKLWVLAQHLAEPAHPGIVAPANAVYVLGLLRRAVELCAAGGPFDGLVTAPIHKSVINDAGIAFSGHTEYLAAITGAAQPVMLLVREGLRVALATTHVPLAQVPAAITRERLMRVVEVLDQDLRVQFGIPRPRILVCGLNPHAGEEGYLGTEEIEVISPALATLRQRGLDLVGPVSADTAFTRERSRDISAILAMFHDQGLPVIKATGFGEIVNVTLGLPIIRTSVDHGTALELAGTGKASATSLVEAVTLAAHLVRTRAHA